MNIIVMTNTLTFPPQTEGGAEETRLSLEIRSRRWVGEWDLINMLASWSSEEKGLQKEAIMLKTMTNKVAIYLIVFGELVTTLLWVMQIALQLSRWMEELVDCGAPISTKNHWSHRISEVGTTKARYSTFVLERATTNCLCLNHFMKFQINVNDLLGFCKSESFVHWVRPFKSKASLPSGEKE